jgi:hypothetical protein
MKFVIRIPEHGSGGVSHLVAFNEATNVLAARCVGGYEPREGWYEPVDNYGKPNEVTCVKCVRRLMHLVPGSEYQQLVHNKVY